MLQGDILEDDDESKGEDAIVDAATVPGRGTEHKAD